MNRKNRKRFFLALSMLTAFALWTAALQQVDVQPIGPQGSSVGFATMNQCIRNLTGVHMTLYTVTDWLGLVPIGFMTGFAALGLVQWLRRKLLRKVDFSILILGGFYVLVLSTYLLFEKLAINYRPVLINGVLEASYPSSTTLLVLCVMPTAIMQLNQRIRNKGIKAIVTYAITAFTAFMVIGRLLSGVHWFSDIIGGLLLSAGLVSLYAAIVGLKKD